MYASHANARFRVAFTPHRNGHRCRTRHTLIRQPIVFQADNQWDQSNASGTRRTATNPIWDSDIAQGLQPPPAADFRLNNIYWQRQDGELTPNRPVPHCVPRALSAFRVHKNTNTHDRRRIVYW